MPTPSPLRPLISAFVMLLAAAALPACKPSPPPEPPTTIVMHTYTVRGQVEQLPDPADARKEFVVRHEEIPEFKGPDGQIGMKAMVMPFPMGEGFSTGGLAVGTKIELTFTVRFDTATNRPKAYHADSWKPLDPATELDFTDRSPKAGG